MKICEFKRALILLSLIIHWLVVDERQCVWTAPERRKLVPKTPYLWCLNQSCRRERNSAVCSESPDRGRATPLTVRLDYPVPLQRLRTALCRRCSHTASDVWRRVRERGERGSERSGPSLTG